MWWIARYTVDGVPEEKKIQADNYFTATVRFWGSMIFRGGKIHLQEIVKDTTITFSQN